MLFRATQYAAKSLSEDISTAPPPIKVQDVKHARGLASEITQSGAKLYDLLASEANARFVSSFISMCKMF